MSIVIQTGHQSSCSDQLMQMLYEKGLGKPILSHAYQLSADEVSEKLAKSFAKGSLTTNTKVVENLMVDLLLANLDQDDWGWSNRDNLHTLPYWREVDSGVRFILVFDSPKLLFKHLKNQEITLALLDEKINEWLEYHKKLLTFFESEPGNCLMVEGRLAVNNLINIKEYIQVVATNLRIESDCQSQILAYDQDSNDDLTFDILINEILKQYPECLMLYEQLTEKSIIRLRNKQVLASNHLENLLHSLNSFNKQDVLKDGLSIQNADLQNQLSLVTEEKRALMQKLDEKKPLSEQNHHDIQRMEQENKLLVSQLHQAQDELERFYLESQKLKSEKTKELPKPVYYGAADRVKEDLPYRLGATMVSHSKSAKDLAVLPLALAKEYREFNKNKPADNLPIIEEYQDAQEAEKVKKHLSYRLGKTLVDGIRSKKVLDLPVKLGREIMEFKGR